MYSYCFFQSVGLAPAPCTLINVLAAFLLSCVYRKKSVLSHKWDLPSKNTMLYSVIGHDVISGETRLSI